MLLRCCASSSRRWIAAALTLFSSSSSSPRRNVSSFVWPTSSKSRLERFSTAGSSSSRSNVPCIFSSSSIHTALHRSPRRMASSSSSAAALDNNEERQQSASTNIRLIDIGANLLDDRFTKGIYRGTFRHEPDVDEIMQRAISVGIKRIILTAGTLQESREAVRMARRWNGRYGGKSTNGGIHFSCTVGVHPTRCQQEFVDACTNPDNNNDATETAARTPDDILQELLEIAKEGQADGTVVAIGEIGLDYDRLEFCSKDVQHEYLIRQLQVLAAETRLPLFLHNRSVGQDLYDILKKHSDCWKRSGGVVHSFDATLELANLFIDDLELYIGLNGCSLRTEASLDVCRALNLRRILLETDCPYCEVRKTHPGYNHIQTHFEGAKAEKKFQRGCTVKSRQEPCHLIQVAEIVAGVKDVPLQQVADATYQNALQLYKFSGGNDEIHRKNATMRL